MLNFKIFKVPFLVGSILALMTISISANALTSACIRYPGITIAHVVTWTFVEQLAYDITIYQSNFEGPNAPYPGITAVSQVTTDTPQPVGHWLGGWAPGLWQVLGDSNQFAIISTNPLEIIVNTPDGCIEDYMLL